MSSNIAISSANVTMPAAQQVLEAGISAAKAMGIPMSIVIVDAAGQIKLAARMDGATMLSYDVASRKAWTSAMTRAPTSGVHEFVASDAGSLISMPNVQNFTLVAGGLPLQADEQCIGAVGVSGATAELDLQVAEAAVKALAK